MEKSCRSGTRKGGGRRSDFPRVSCPSLPQKKSGHTHFGNDTKTPRERSKVYLNMSIDASQYFSNDSWQLKLVKNKLLLNQFHFLARGELSRWLGNHDIGCKQWKVCNRFPIVSSSAAAFMHSLSGR